MSLPIGCGNDGPIRATRMGEFSDEFTSTNYYEGRHCVHPECNKLITDGAHTCAQHKGWYRREIAEKAKRQVQRLIKRAKEKQDE